MKNRAKTIQIYLPEGNPRGIKVADITSRNTAVLQFPRANIEAALARQELQKPGVYFLIGHDEEVDAPLIYIGEAEDCSNRLKQHNSSKDFWTHALVVSSKTDDFTKSHVKYLEWHCCKKAEGANRYRLDNSNSPSKPHIQEPVEADLLDCFDTFSVLVSTLGYPIFDEPEKIKTRKIFHCTGPDAFGKGYYSEDGMVVLKGSVVRKQQAKTTGTWIINHRTKLVDQGILIEKDENSYEFKTNYTFASPSASAGVILGRRSNGWADWKLPDKSATLDDIYRKN